MSYKDRRHCRSIVVRPFVRSSFRSGSDDDADVSSGGVFSDARTRLPEERRRIAVLGLRKALAH